MHGQPESLHHTPGQIATLALLALIAAYALATAVAGYNVGRAISSAKANPLGAIASSMAGRDATERFAIERLHVPVVVTASPTFWLALRMSE
jgi:hypothetical protein